MRIKEQTLYFKQSELECLMNLSSSDLLTMLERFDIKGYMLRPQDEELHFPASKSFRLANKYLAGELEGYSRPETFRNTPERRTLLEQMTRWNMRLDVWTTP